MFVPDIFGHSQRRELNMILLSFCGAAKTRMDSHSRTIRVPYFFGFLLSRLFVSLFPNFKKVTDAARGF